MSFALVVLGSGCPTRVPPYVAGQIPSDVQLRIMTSDEREAGMRQMLVEHPMPVLTAAQKEAQVKDARELIAKGTSERIAHYEKRVHAAQGLARFVTHGSQAFLVFSDDFQIDPAPSLTVVLSEQADPTDADELGQKGTIDLGPLQSATGGQLYLLPAGTDLARYRSIVIYCKPFKAVMAVAGVR